MINISHKEIGMIIKGTVIKINRHPKIDPNNPFRSPTYSIDLKGRCGGKAYYLSKRIKLNLDLPNKIEELKTVIVHEICHVAAYHIYGEVKPHGKEWKSLMVFLGYKPERCHKMDVSNYTQKGTTYKYKCESCDFTMWFGKVRHNRSQKGSSSYKHKKDKGNMIFTGISKRG